MRIWDEEFMQTVRGARWMEKHLLLLLQSAEWVDAGGTDRSVWPKGDVRGSGFGMAFLPNVGRRG